MSSDVRSAADVQVGDAVSFRLKVPDGDSVVGEVVRGTAARLTVEYRGKRYTFAYTYQHYVGGWNGGMRTSVRFRKLDARDLWRARQPKTTHVEIDHGGCFRFEPRAYAEARDVVLAELDALVAWQAEEPPKEKR